MKSPLTWCLICFLLVSSNRLLAQWPREIMLKNGGKVSVYEPQPETLSGNRVTGRGAVSVRETATAEPVFGAIFYDAVLSTDKDSRLADLESVKITNAKFPGVEDSSKLNALKALIEKTAPTWKLEISIEQIMASVKKESGKTDEAFRMDPPKVIYRNKPTTLVLIDGEPRIQKDKDLDADRVINTPYLIFKEGSQWNMYTGGTWYKSQAVTEGWTQNSKLSKKVKSVNDQIKKKEKEDNQGKENTAKPVVTDILVSTEPAELIQTNGEPAYKSIQGTSLLYVSNSDSEIFKDINSQHTYVLIAGRWYTAPGINGPWTFVAADKLPADFAKIPEGSEKDAVLANVAGTDAAEEARINAEIPQTAKVDRKTATVNVTYDGDPKFEKIEGTSMELAVNSGTTVMRSGGKYYAVENGVWFESTSPKGPWRVATERPADVDNIPASSSAYNTKYVYIYETTPQYVYMGYTPGYMGCYVYGPTVIYGTGYHYAPWYGAAYYPRPVTWGFGFSYNPWTGWSMSIGFSTGFMNVGFTFGGYGGYYGGWFGPPMYRPPYRPPYYGGYYGGRGPVNINTGDININTGDRVRVDHHDNIYNNRQGVSTKDIDRTQVSTRPANNNRPTAGTRPATADRPATRNSNVYADRDGNVYQKTESGNWNQRDNKSRDWKPVDQTRDASRVNDLNKSSYERNRATTQHNNYQQSRSTYRPTSRPAARPSGGRRRG